MGIDSGALVAAARGILGGTDLANERKRKRELQDAELARRREGDALDRATALIQLLNTPGVSMGGEPAGAPPAMAPLRTGPLDLPTVATPPIADTGGAAPAGPGVLEQARGLFGMDGGTPGGDALTTPPPPPGIGNATQSGPGLIEQAADLFGVTPSVSRETSYGPAITDADPGMGGVLPKPPVSSGADGDIVGRAAQLLQLPGGLTYDPSQGAGAVRARELRRQEAEQRQVYDLLHEMEPDAYPQFLPRVDYAKEYTELLEQREKGRAEQLKEARLERARLQAEDRREGRRDEREDRRERRREARGDRRGADKDLDAEVERYVRAANGDGGRGYAMYLNDKGTTTVRDPALSRRFAAVAQKLRKPPPRGKGKGGEKAKAMSAVPGKEAEVARRIRELNAEGETREEISRQLASEGLISP